MRAKARLAGGRQSAGALSSPNSLSRAFTPPARKRKVLPMCPVQNVTDVSGRSPGECMRAITLDEAVKIINETFAEAKRRNAYPLTAVLLDAGGRVKAALKQDGASLLRFEVSYGKAYAALAMGRESRQVLQKAKDKPLFMQSFLELADGPMFLEGGGQLIRDKDGEVVGAIATTGDTNEVDDLCAIAGIRAAGFKTDHDFGEADMRRLNIKRGLPIEDPEKSKPQLKSV